MGKFMPSPTELKVLRLIAENPDSDSGFLAFVSNDVAKASMESAFCALKRNGFAAGNNKEGWRLTEKGKRFI